MKAITLIAFLSVVAFVRGYVILGNRFQWANKEFLQQQKTILEVLRNVNQPELQAQYYQDGLTYNIEENYNLYNNVDAVKEFVNYYNTGVVQKDEVFSVLNEKQRNYAVALFHVLYYAKDWDAFYKSLVWANVHVNRGVFIYALTVAVVHRNDMVGMELPAPYELYPYYFFNTDVIQRAQTAVLQGFAGKKKVEGVYNVIVQSNYTTDYVSVNDDQKISYFTEDIGLNTYYYYFHTDYPFWLGGQEFNLNVDRRGELYLFQHQQLLARYYLERLSNDLGEIPELSYFHPVKNGYYPNLRYYNGMFFPPRDNNFNFYTEYNYYDVAQIEDYERRIRDAIDAGFVTLPDGTKIDLTQPESVNELGNMIQGNPDVQNKQYFKYIEVFARLLLGSTVEHYDQPKVLPSVLEHFETSMRDPLFYSLYKRLVKYYWQFKNHLEPYTRDQLLFQGVKITSAEVDKLVTYFDSYDSDITNVVDVPYSQVQVDQPSTTEHFGIGQGGYSQNNLIPGANVQNVDWSEIGFEVPPAGYQGNKQKLVQTTEQPAYIQPSFGAYTSRQVHPASTQFLQYLRSVFGFYPLYQQELMPQPQAQLQSQPQSMPQNVLLSQYQYQPEGQVNVVNQPKSQFESGLQSQYQPELQYQAQPQSLYPTQSQYGSQPQYQSRLQSQYQSDMQYHPQPQYPGQSQYQPSGPQNKFVIKARQQRLNHAPFTLKLNVFSDKPTKAVVRVYLGPKYDETGNLLSVNENRENFWVLDVFPVDLTVGQNLVVRNSRNFTWFVQDRTPYNELYSWVQGAYNGFNKFPLDMTEAHCGFPQRLMIPKGKLGGQAFQLFFIVTPYVAPNIEQGSNYNYIINCGVGSGARYLDNLPMGYPFDRRIDESAWYTPNMFSYDTVIYNRKSVDAFPKFPLYH